MRSTVFVDGYAVSLGWFSNGKSSGDDSRIFTFSHLTDKAGIQFHVLNKSKGPAVHVSYESFSHSDTFSLT